jgi:hypothetical protein
VFNEAKTFDRVGQDSQSVDCFKSPRIAQRQDRPRAIRCTFRAPRSGARRNTEITATHLQRYDRPAGEAKTQAHEVRAPRGLVARNGERPCCHAYARSRRKTLQTFNVSENAIVRRTSIHRFETTRREVEQAKNRGTSRAPRIGDPLKHRGRSNDISELYDEATHRDDTPIEFRGCPPSLQLRGCRPSEESQARCLPQQKTTCSKQKTQVPRRTTILRKVRLRGCAKFCGIWIPDSGFWSGIRNPVPQIKP